MCTAMSHVAKMPGRVKTVASNLYFGGRLPGLKGAFSSVSTNSRDSILSACALRETTLRILEGLKWLE